MAPRRAGFQKKKFSVLDMMERNVMELKKAATMAADSALGGRGRHHEDKHGCDYEHLASLHLPRHDDRTELQVEDLP